MRARFSELHLPCFIQWVHSALPSPHGSECRSFLGQRVFEKRFFFRSATEFQAILCKSSINLRFCVEQIYSNRMWATPRSFILKVFIDLRSTDYSKEFFFVRGEELFSCVFEDGMGKYSNGAHVQNPDCSGKFGKSLSCVEVFVHKRMISLHIYLIFLIYTAVEFL